MSASCFRGFKWCLCREIAAQRKYLFVVMLPLIDFLATPFCRKTAEDLCSIVKHNPPEQLLTTATNPYKSMMTQESIYLIFYMLPALSSKYSKASMKLQMH